jgi:nucleotide-binding universal stress UspA family protein
MNTGSLYRKVIWAFDALEEPDYQKNALFLLGAIGRGTSAQIDPVFILNPPYTDVALTAPSDLEQAYAALAEKRLQEIKTKSDIATMTSGKVLISHETSVRNQAKFLIDYAKDQNADAIVVATHARKGVARFFLGSFAESLALYSDLPVFSVNPTAKVREKISNILFPTTFYPRWRPAFEEAVRLARAMDAGMTMFYREPVIPMNQMSPALILYMEREQSQRRVTAREWQRYANENGVPTEFKIEDQPGYLDASIVDFATSGKFDLIAMATQSDAASSVLMGSATRQVIRQAPCPVWVVRIDENKENL